MMKTSSLLSITFVGAALMLGAIGCKRGPQGITDIPHPGISTPSVTQPPRTPDNIPPAPTGPGPGSTVTPAPQPNGEGIPSTAGDTPWSKTIAGGAEDRTILKDDTVLFDYDSATIKKTEDKKLEAVANYLKANMADALRIEGNCDERGTEKYNLALGEKRAQAAREYLVNLGIDSRQIVTVTFGAAKPVDPAHNDAAWKKNRRGDMILLTPQK
jgi:peptidoglycan-associated lipoprotein